jgi:hypothetical protein
MPSKALHPLRHVSLKPSAALLAVVYDVHTCRTLLRDHMFYRRVNQPSELLILHATALLSLDKQFNKCLCAWKTADVGR